jgi:hypothetical protein
MEFNTCKRPWRPMVLSGVGDPPLSCQSAHRWRLGLQPYMPAELYPQKFSSTHLCYRPSKPQSHSAAGRIRCTEKKKPMTVSGVEPANFRLVV